MSNNNEKQADVNEVINALSQQIAQLSTDNAILQSIINQYKKDEKAE